MESISVFDMLKIGVGPSSSHTLGPWRAVQRWLRELAEAVDLRAVERVEIALYGSLALTGHGHATDVAVCLALLGYDPETIPVEQIPTLMDTLRTEQQIVLPSGTALAFNPATDIVFHKDIRLPFHANGMTCRAQIGETWQESTYFSVGGGFVLKEGETLGGDQRTLRYACHVPADVAAHCTREGLRIAEMVGANEQAWRSPEQIRTDMLGVWEVMKQSIYRGCHRDGMLPGGLNVKRRAHGLNLKLLGEPAYDDADGWITAIRARRHRFSDVLKWVSCFALAVNEENASLGRVVTAPTNGASGVIPAVLMYYICFSETRVTDNAIVDFLMVAGEIGSLFKKGATISAAMGGCQAEIGVSSSMAAAALTEALGGSVDQALMAAEIAMEHHLGLTCDPVRGLVQIPCIERNTMGAIKAIHAAELAVESDPHAAKVTLDEVIQTMFKTALDMKDEYKETSQGGLAVNISVRIPEC